MSAFGGIKTTFYRIEYMTEGAACTVLLTKDLINNDEPLVIANCIHLFEIRNRAFDRCNSL